MCAGEIKGSKRQQPSKDVIFTFCELTDRKQHSSKNGYRCYEMVCTAKIYTGH